MLFMGIIALTFIVSGVLIVNGLNSTDSVVQDNWYLEGKALDNDLSLDSTASLYGVTATLLTTGNSLSVSINSTNPLPPGKQALHLNLYHATLATRDQHYTLSPTSANTFTLSNFSSNKLPAGKYIVELSNGSWRLRAVHNLPKGVIKLQALPLAQTIYKP
jgi:hypothetical protein